MSHWRAAFTALAVTLLACAAGGCGSGGGPPAFPPGVWVVPRDTDLPRQSGDVPARFVGIAPVVEARINGRGPFRLILDTGASALVLSPEAAAALALPPTDVAVNMSGMAAGALRRVRSLRVGPARFNNVDAAVVNMAPMRVALGEIDGVVGLAVFRDCLLTIDYPARRVTLGRGRLPRPDGKDVLPLRWLPAGVAMVPLRAGGRPILATLDTGSNGALHLPPPLADELPLAGEPVAGPWMAATAHGFRPFRTARLAADVTLGRHRLVRPVVELSDPRPPMQGLAVLGASALQHFAVTIDQRRGAARFSRPPPAGPIEFPPARHGGFLYTREPGALVVTGPIEGVSLTDLGLRAGDRVTAVNGRPVADLTETDLTHLTRTADRWECDVDRGGERTRVRFALPVLVP